MFERCSYPQIIPAIVKLDHSFCTLLVQKEMCIDFQRVQKLIMKIYLALLKF